MSCHAAVLGTGTWARVHLQAMTASPHVSQVTLVGRNAAALSELASQFPKVVRTTTDMADALAEGPVRWVDICLPHHLHTSATQAALAAGKDVICEKPAALALDAFDASVELARQQGRRLLVVLNQLYNPLVVRVRELVDQGALGRVFLSVENAYSNASRDYRRSDVWRTSRDFSGGGLLIDGGFHMVYRHLFYLGSYGWPRWVQAAVEQLNVDRSGRFVPEKGEDFVSIVVGYEAPLRIQWAHAWTFEADVARRRQCFLAGSEGSLELTDDSGRPLVLHTASGQREIDVPAGPHSPRDTTIACLLDYYECLATGREPARANLRLARASLDVVLSAYEVGQSGRRQPLA